MRGSDSGACGEEAEPASAASAITASSPPTSTTSSSPALISVSTPLAGAGDFGVSTLSVLTSSSGSSAVTSSPTSLEPACDSSPR